MECIYLIFIFMPHVMLRYVTFFIVLKINILYLNLD